ncbi:unnamed protein product [Rotaria socialis]|uniref:NAD(P)(+)--arginine ADP-ribosyltransferase n=1 Tax=Rotaria socialis TaxID=392032 RepID=A0A821MQL8_9BILA|nr:unnamed protein product [Rotaria socialis]CAF4770930.1 unnamed protein product [Rotaria socialis]
MYPNQRDRFANLLPGVTEDQFRNSQFLKISNQVEKYPSCSAVVESLLTIEDINDRSHPVLVSLEKHSDSHDAIKIYSSYMDVGPLKFYKYVNEQLLADDKDTLTKLMPFIRRATYQINHNSANEDTILYRGMNLNEQQQDFFRIGKFFRFPGFTATTAKKHIARSFGKTLFEIHVSAPCHQVINMANISYFQEEEEWLFSPYSRFRVKDKTKELIILQSTDDSSDADEQSCTSDADKDESTDSEDHNSDDDEEDHSHNNEEPKSSSDENSTSCETDETSESDNVVSNDSRCDEEDLSDNTDNRSSDNSSDLNSNNDEQNSSYDSDEKSSNDDSDSHHSSYDDE